MLGFVNLLLTIPRYNEHFGSFPENSLNGGVRYNVPSIRNKFPQSLGILLNRGSIVTYKLGETFIFTNEKTRMLTNLCIPRSNGNKSGESEGKSKQRENEGHTIVKYRKIPKISPSMYKPPKLVTQKTLR